MVLLDKLWDDAMGGPHPDRGLGKLRKLTTLTIKEEGEGGSKLFQRSMSTPSSPSTPTTPSPTAAARKDNVWRSVFHPGSNLATKGIGAQMFDKPQPNSPTVYDWLYSGETRSKHR
ncbi:Dormancyauxin associated protein [Actinidia chinensis var. chinensis]|uniref:Dormancyauxin associated protein n=1 Tax=Actinidia chinensis var. chinensis TaxID=1590841 RepID=A0A2R6PXZ1_ACTCC|nr:Dormancyauxin associated protein [Actinidia chinensis var. chinensis]